MATFSPVWLGSCRGDAGGCSCSEAMLRNLVAKANRGTVPGTCRQGWLSTSAVDRRDFEASIVPSSPGLSKQAPLLSSTGRTAEFGCAARGSAPIPALDPPRVCLPAKTPAGTLLELQRACGVWARTARFCELHQRTVLLRILLTSPLIPA
jgi:hypothetical protein